eukprot:6108868-Pleurochrysis_carterae.AAC.1
MCPRVEARACEPGAQLIAFGAKPSGGTAPEPTVRIAGSESKMLADDADCAEDGACATRARARRNGKRRLGIGDDRRRHLSESTRASVTKERGEREAVQGKKARGTRRVAEA